MRCDAMALRHCALQTDGDGERRRDTIAQNAVRVFFHLGRAGYAATAALTCHDAAASVKFQSSLLLLHSRTHERSLGSLMCMMTMTLAKMSPRFF